MNLLPNLQRFRHLHFLLDDFQKISGKNQGKGTMNSLYLVWCLPLNAGDELSNLVKNSTTHVHIMKLGWISFNTSFSRAIQSIHLKYIHNPFIHGIFKLNSNRSFHIHTYITSIHDFIHLFNRWLLTTSMPTNWNKFEYIDSILPISEDRFESIMAYFFLKTI